VRAALRPVHSRAVALVALAALLPIAWLLLRGGLDLTAAATRAVVVLLGAIVADRVLVPVVGLLLQPPGPPDPPEPDADPTPTTGEAAKPR
jgi:hypothetical protein